MSIFKSIERFRYQTGLVVFTALFTGCTGSTGPSLFNGGTLDQIYSTRPSQGLDVLTVIRLKNPSLLSQVKLVDGKIAIDRDLLAAIEAEQKETIVALQEISSEIKILNQYKLVVNGLSIWAPAGTLEKIQQLGNVTLSEKPAEIPRLQVVAGPKFPVGANTSVNFIGAEEAYKIGIKGQGKRVGIIDTGVDYTHKMFLGEGTEEAFKAIDPSQPSAAFPNKKVVGGIDLVGTRFNSSSQNLEDRIPLPDANPIDEATHGTHVAGTVAGIGDGIETYSGVAPEALIYALKVFGKEGSTRDDVVIAALEYAADPNQNLSFKDQLDVVNLSLGASYGNPRILYNEAIRNLVKAGTMVVASAGNEGDVPFITGAPAISDDSLSVASSVDNQDINILASAAKFTLENEELLTEIVEAATTKPLNDFSSVKGELVDLGLAAEELDSIIKEQVRGNIALISRGQVSFDDKISRAQDAGAIAVVVTQSTDDAAMPMGGEGSFNIPAVMISKSDGIKIREQMKTEVVVADLKSDKKINKEWRIDTISDFSSRGPRSDDGAIKPEITGPGTNITSAQAGSGAKGLTISGTSMSGPHLAGVAALLKQKFPTATPTDLKSIIMGHAKIISQPTGESYPVARQGAGRVQVAQSLAAQVVTSPAALSFGITDLEQGKELLLNLKVKNISKQKIEGQFTWNGKSGFDLRAPSITLEPESEKTIVVKAILRQKSMEGTEEEFDGYLKLQSKDQQLIQIPALVVVRKVSFIKGDAVRVSATSSVGAAGSTAELTLQNISHIPGDAYLFNLLGTDGRKINQHQVLDANRNCDLQSSGYRILEKDGVKVLQVALKLYEGMTTWHRCEVNVQIDSNGDKVADQELAGTVQSDLPGLKSSEFGSILLDARIARDLRKKFEQALVDTPTTAKEDYNTAVQEIRPMKVFNNSTLAIIEADISSLQLGASGEMSLKVSTTHQDSGIIEFDDFLGSKKWKRISTGPQAAGFVRLPEVVHIPGKSSQVISFEKGFGIEDLILYSPSNTAVRDRLLKDQQSQSLKTIYQMP